MNIFPIEWDDFQKIDFFLPSKPGSPLNAVMTNIIVKICINLICIMKTMKNVWNSWFLTIIFRTIENQEENSNKSCRFYPNTYFMLPSSFSHEWWFSRKTWMKLKSSRKGEWILVWCEPCSTVLAIWSKKEFFFVTKDRSRSSQRVLVSLKRIPCPNFSYTSGVGDIPPKSEKIASCSHIWNNITRAANVCSKIHLRQRLVLIFTFHFHSGSPLTDFYSSKYSTL